MRDIALPTQIFGAIAGGGPLGETRKSRHFTHLKDGVDKGARGFYRDKVPPLLRSNEHTKHPPATQRVQTDLNNVDAELVCDTGEAARKHDGDPLVDCERVPSYDSSNLLSFDADADEWAQWESLIVGEGFPYVDMTWQF